MPFETASASNVADEDGEGMRQLVIAMIPANKYTYSELVDLCRTLEIFSGVIGSSDTEMSREQRFAFGQLLTRYNDRIVGDFRFSIDGKGHAKRFFVQHNATVTGGKY